MLILIYHKEPPETSTFERLNVKYWILSAFLFVTHLHPVLSQKRCYPGTINEIVKGCKGTDSLIAFNQNQKKKKNYPTLYSRHLEKGLTALLPRMLISKLATNMFLFLYPSEIVSATSNRY